jgi:hypothetical protein
MCSKIFGGKDPLFGELRIVVQIRHMQEDDKSDLCVGTVQCF